MPGNRLGLGLGRRGARWQKQRQERDRIPVGAEIGARRIEQEHDRTIARRRGPEPERGAVLGLERPARGRRAERAQRDREPARADAPRAIELIAERRVRVPAEPGRLRAARRQLALDRVDDDVGESPARARPDGVDAHADESFVDEPRAPDGPLLRIAEAHLAAGAWPSHRRERVRAPACEAQLDLTRFCLQTFGHGDVGDVRTGSTKQANFLRFRAAAALTYRFGVGRFFEFPLPSLVLSRNLWIPYEHEPGVQ